MGESNDAGSLASKLRRLAGLMFNLGPEPDSYPTTKIAKGCSKLYVEDQVSEIRARYADLAAEAQEIEDPEERQARETALQEALEAEIEAAEKRVLVHYSYVSDLIYGKRDNPTMLVLQYLGKFFGVPPAFFFAGDQETEETREAEREVELAAAALDLLKRLEGSGQSDAGQLLTAMMRGAQEVPPEVAMGMFHMQLAAIEQASKRRPRG